MAMFDQNDSAALLGAILTDTPYVTVTATHIRLGTSAPSATANMTELGGGSGYTTGGSAITWNAVSAGAPSTTSNSSTVSWTNSGSSWSLVGLEIWNSGATVRYLFGSWTGQPISVPTGDTFQCSAAGVAIGLT